MAGIDEAKIELTEIVDFLRNPDKYRRLGGRIPRGVLLSGPPGTGKTLLARAVAGEAGRPVLLDVRLGVHRDDRGRRRLAACATCSRRPRRPPRRSSSSTSSTPIGRSRSKGAGGVGGGHDEREQTLNQILTEMDGFDPTSGVIVLAATNRPDVLDSALLRPGRFDRRVAVQPPDKNGRLLILTGAHALGAARRRRRPRPLAATTPGMVGADLANLVNEAALLAARRDHETGRAAPTSPTPCEKIMLGAERRT